MTTDARIQLKNPNTGRDDVKIARRLYDPVREAIVAAVGDAGRLAFQDLRTEVERRTADELWRDASVGWYTTAVKLDLEARGVIRRVPGSSPQLLELV